MKQLFQNAMIFGRLCDFTVENGVFTEFTAHQTIKENGIDLNRSVVMPGFVEVHAHGAIGYDTMEGHLSEMASFLAKNGTTTWFPTTMTMSKEDIRRAVSVDLSQIVGATVPGFHLEGPFLAEKYKGAQNRDFLSPPDLDFIRSLPHVSLITLAPELPGSAAFIQQTDAVVAIGHTNADYAETVAAIDAGAVCLTHTCNAMPPLLHRAPGPIGAAAEKGIYAQVITDGVHIHKGMIHALYKLFGKERFVMISDSMRATGLPDGVCMFGGQEVYVKNGEARLSDGTLAGSTSTLYMCAKKMLSFGYTLAEIAAMASENPARMMGLKTGKLAVGYAADFLVTDDALSSLSAVYIKGSRFA